MPCRPGIAYLRYLPLVAEKTSHRRVRQNMVRKRYKRDIVTGHIGWAIATIIMTKSFRYKDDFVNLNFNFKFQFKGLQQLPRL